MYFLENLKKQEAKVFINSMIEEFTKRGFNTSALDSFFKSYENKEDAKSYIIGVLMSQLEIALKNQKKGA